MRSSELAEALVQGRPTTTRMCDRLEHDGLIRRERREQDGRAVEVVLTKKGRDEYRRCQPAYERFVEDLFGRYGQSMSARRDASGSPGVGGSSVRRDR